jgi:tetratricopeptide (TPR) repeat protein
VPVTARAIVEVGPDLIETFLAGPRLIERAEAAADGESAWLLRLGRLVAARTATQAPAELEQQNLIDQYTRVLEHVAQDQPLIIILEDLHWADRGTIDLLLHIGRRLADSRLLILCAYRPDEIASGRDSGPHPLEEGVNELRSLHGDIVIDLAREEPAATWQFVNELVDVEPNRLGQAFRRALHDCTAGHPLFTVEMLRMLKEQKDLVQDIHGRWIEAQTLAWDNVPVRVEAVIQKRVNRLGPLAHEVLGVASVEGEDFAAEVVSRVLDQPKRQVLRCLSQDLGRKHRLIHDRGEARAGRQPISRFRFTHNLIQRYVYQSLSAGERRTLHESVAGALEHLFAADPEPVTIPLAYHYGHTGATEKTLHYLAEAGHQARKRYDGHQAIDFYTEALSLVPDDRPDRFHLLAARAAVYDILAKRKAQKTDLDAMEALAIQLDDEGLLCDAQLAIAEFYLVTEIFTARKPAQQALALAQAIDDRVREARALRLLSWEGRLGADFETSRVYLEEAAARFKAAGLPGEATVCLFMLMRRLGGSAKHVLDFEAAEEAFALAVASGDYGLQALARRNLAIAHIGQERYESALPLAREALAMHQDLGNRREQCDSLDALGVVLARSGRPEAAEAEFRRCLALAEEIGYDWGVLCAVFGLWNYWYLPRGECEQLLDFVDDRLAGISFNERAWTVGFLVWMKAWHLAEMGQLETAYALAQTEEYRTTEADLLSSVFVLQGPASIEAELGYYDQARLGLARSVEVAEQTSDRYLLSWPLIVQARLALYEGTEDGMYRGLKHAQLAIDVTSEVREERQWAEALDVSARLHLALGQPEKAFAESCQAMKLLETHPWLPKPQYHLYTHSLVLRALGRHDEAHGYLQRARERVMYVAANMSDGALRWGWLENVRVNREILEEWQESGAGE